MNKRLLSFALISAIAFFVFMNISYSNKNFAPVGNTNAPSENTCARSGCHSSFPLDQNQLERISITANGTAIDANFTYTPSTTYNIQFIIQNPKARNGFSLTALNESNQYIGTLAASGAPGAQLSNGAGALSSRKYVGHTNSAGVSSWDFQWTAPADSQVVTFYGIANLSNNNNSTNGDSIVTATRTFTMESAIVDTTDTTGTAISNNILNEEVVIYSNPTNTNEINFSLNVVNVKYYTFEVVDISGKQVYANTQVLHTGKQFLSWPIQAANGIYFLRISSEGKFATYKILL